MSEATILDVRDLKRHYQIGGGLLRQAKTLKAVDGVSFTLSAGKTLAVVGESGCGKSTLARMITMIEKPTAGSLKIDDVEVTTADDEAMRKLRPVVQMVFQNPYGSLNPRKQVGTILEEPVVINAKLDGRSAQGSGSRDDGQGRSAAGALHALSAHVLRRPAPAHRHCARPHAQSTHCSG